jgi:hypothetical protein
LQPLSTTEADVTVDEEEEEQVSLAVEDLTLAITRAAVGEENGKYYDCNPLSKPS